MAKASKPKGNSKTKTNVKAKAASKKVAPKSAAPKVAAKKVAAKAAAKKVAAKLATKAKPKSVIAKVKAVAKSVVKKVSKAAATTAKAPSNVVSMDQARSKANAKKSAAPAASPPKSEKSAKTAGGSDATKYFAPLDDRILVKRAPVLTRTAGGLYIPDSVGEKPTEGLVVAVGRGHRSKKGRLRPLDVQLGDKVMFNSHAGSEITLRDEALLILREEEILAVMKS